MPTARLGGDAVAGRVPVLAAEKPSCGLDEYRYGYVWVGLSRMSATAFWGLKLPRERSSRGSTQPRREPTYRRREIGRCPDATKTTLEEPKDE